MSHLELVAASPYDLYLEPALQNGWPYFLIPAILYLPCIMLFSRYMKGKEPIQFKKLLFCWNVVLSVASGVGVVYLAPFAFNSFRTLGISGTICSAAWKTDLTATLVIKYFVLSKVPELFDTFFLIAKKRPVRLLQWYHHITVLVYCWGASLATKTGVGVIFAGMNLFVHMIMYLYFAVATLGVKLRYPWMITVIQIAQMMIGTYVSWQARECEYYWTTLTGLLMYVSYYVLFVEFAISKFICPPKKGQKQAHRLVTFNSTRDVKEKSQ